MREQKRSADAKSVTEANGFQHETSKASLVARHCFVLRLFWFYLNDCEDAIEKFSGDSILTEAVTQRCSVKKAFLEISQNLQENTCARVSF